MEGSVNYQSQRQRGEKIGKRKGHGNRKLQRIRRRGRAQRINELDTSKLSNHSSSGRMDTTVACPSMECTTRDIHKRKRETTSQERMNSATRSMSHLSIVQPTRKRTRDEPPTIVPSVEANALHYPNSIHRQPKYLKIPRRLLIALLPLPIRNNCRRRKETDFVVARLKLLDQKYCLTLHQQLWQCSFDLALQHRRWSKQVMVMAMTCDDALIETFVGQYLKWISEELERCFQQLAVQALRCPIPVSIEALDILFNEFIVVHRRQLTKKLQHEMNKSKASIGDQDRWQQLSSFQLTVDQLELIDRMIALNQQQMQAFEELTKLEQRISCKLLPQSFDDGHLNADETLPLNEQQKKSQQMRRSMLDHLVHELENKLLACTRQYEQELLKFENKDTNQPNVNGMSLFDHVKTYLTHRVVQFKHDLNSNMILFRRTLYRRCRRHRSSAIQETVSVWPQVIIDVPTTPLTAIEFSYISSAGPNYIRPNQSALRPYRQQLLQGQQDHDYLTEKTVSYLSHQCHIPRRAPILKELSVQLKNCLMRRYTAPLSIYDDIRARREHRLVRSIRYKMKKANLVLRPTDKSGVLHIGSATDYERKAIEYRAKTRAYTELSSNPLVDILHKVESVLNDLRSKKYISIKQYSRMRPNRSKTHLAYMYFIPKAHKKETPLRPIMNTINAPTTAISHFLDRLIRPLFDKHARSTIIVDGTDLIHRLQTYVEQGRLKASTLFCTFDITDLYTMLPQQESLNILCEFLAEHGYTKIGGISIDTIRKLASLVVTENAFVYGEKYYKQIIGGAMGSPFTLTLANIFMWKWQQKLVDRLSACNEIYGRYIDDVFFTSNESSETIDRMLDEANRYHPNIKLSGDVGKCVTFLDLCLNNANGTLYTSVYHKEAAEPYVIPFKSDHARHTFGNIIRGALVRAVRYSSTLEIFDKERRYIRLMFLYNGYPSRFLDVQFKKFLTTYNLPHSILLPLTEDEDQYRRTRQQLLQTPTSKQTQLIKSVNSVRLQHHTKNQKADMESNESDVVKRKEHRHCLIVHYTHEKRLQLYKRDIHHIWNQLFLNTPASEVRLIIGNKNSRNIRRELVRTCPHPSLLLGATMRADVAELTTNK